MWKKIMDALDKNKIIAIGTVSALVLVVAAAVFVPKLMNQETFSDNQQMEQQAEQPTEQQNEQQVNQQEQEPEESKTQTDGNEGLLADADSAAKPDAQPKKESGGKKESVIDKIVNIFTGNNGQEDVGINDSDSDASDDDAFGDNASDNNSDVNTTPKPSEDNYNVIFMTDGGSNLKQQTVMAGTKISSLPTPYKDGYLFLGWYYDADHMQPVASTDIIQKDMTLYASYAQEAALETLEKVSFASAQNVGRDFSIKVVTEDETMDADTVMAGITAENLTDPQQEGIIQVTGSNGTFTISGKNPYEQGVNLEALDGFAEGSTFRVSLNDARLNFQGQPDSVREYNFTTDKEEVLNLALNDSLQYISVEELSNITNNGENVAALSIALYQAEQDGKVGPTELTQGSFEYAGNLSVGDVVAVYAGLRPDLRSNDTPKEQLGDVGYVEITGRNGKLYSYKNAEAEDVIFEPDMLPVSVLADKDGDSENHAITVDNKHFDYSADVYANIELDSQTTVDVGDFLMFYSGDFGTVSGSDAAQLLDQYGKITEVTLNDDGTTTVLYTDADWDEVQAAMDVYTSQRMSGAELLEGIDTEELEAQIEQQAIDSGFAEEAAQYLASMALATDNFTKLSENVNLQDFKVTLEDGTPISPEELQLMDNSIKVDFELEDDYPKAAISIHPTHFDGVEGTDAVDKGLSISLEIKAKITIDKRGSDNQIVITVSGTFVEEVGVDMGLSSKAVWKVWGIFPYIAEYRVTANVDVLNYTGIEVNATMVTKTSDDDEDDDKDDGEDITEMIKNLLESKEEEGEEEDSGETSNKLVKRYSEMLEEESDFIKIVDQNITEKEKQLPPALPIIAVNFSLDFVVQLDACVSIGFDFEYMTGKRYTFAIDVFGKGVKCDTVVLLEETYEFSFYAMGRLAIRAGLEMEFEVGLFTTKLDSVGVSAQAGAYTKLWGYFYYELRYTASQGRSQKYNGALLIEVGAYLEIGLKAQALNGYFSKELNVLEKEWPIWFAGRADNILDFATEEEDMPDIKLKQHVRSTVIPDSVFSLDYLDLKEGKEKTAVYNDYFDESQKVSETNRRNFVITMTNDKFSYDPQTNTVSVHPAEGDKKLEGEMIITWINYPLAFSSKPIQRTISLYWDNVRDGYVIVPYTNGGSYIPIMEAKYESKVTAPADPEKLGYNFEGWYSDEELTTPYVFPEKMPAQDTNIYAKWSERTDTPYRVEHYQEQLLSGEYELVEAEDFTGTTNSYVTPEVKTYTGYKSPAKQEIKILPDGSAVLRYYYALQWHQVTFEPGEVGGEAVTYDLKYGGKVIAPVMAAKGYTFTDWDKEVAGTMGTEDVTYTAQWTKNPDTSYRVEYYVQQADGSYALQHLIEATGFTGGQLTADDLRSRLVDDGLTADEKLTVENVIVFENMTVKGVSCETASIEGSGKTIIKINYKRLKHTVTFDFGYDDKSVSAQVSYGESVSIPTAVRTGYKFKGWSVDGTTIVTPSDKMGISDVRYTALWTPVAYSVVFDKNNDAASGTMESMQFAYDTAQNLHTNAFTVEGYTFAGWAKQQGGSIDFADGASVNNLADTDGAAVTLYAVWNLTEYTITYNGCEEAENVNPTTYTAESESITLSAPVRTGYDFGGWYENAEFSGDAVTVINKGSSGDRILYAKWTADANTAYRVEHYKEALDSSWALAETEHATGSIDIPVTPDVKEYTGFSAPQTQTVSIAADGTTVVRYEYTRNEYTVTLNAGEGTLPEGTDTMTVKYGASFTLPTPEREGYGFSGWYNGENKFTENVMPAENLVLSAQWTAGQYTYTVNHYLQNVDGDGYTLTASLTDTAAMGTEVAAVINSYTGFTSPEETKTITIGTEESANAADYYYTRNQYTLTWNLAGGSAEGYTEGSVYYGAHITAPVPVKAGYSFSWDKTPVTEMPAEDIAYTVSWTANTYEVMFHVNGGNVTAGSAQTREVVFDGVYGELATLEKAGYTFDGWFTDPEGGTQVTAETKITTAANHAIYAHFTPVSFSITYNGVEGATHTNPTIYNAETGAVTLLAAQKAGYTFAGWYESEDFSTAEVKTIPVGSVGDKNYYAKWKENSYKVIFHSNNGNDSTNSQSFTYTESKALAANSYTKAGYQFGGWAAESNAAAAKYTEQQIVSGLSAAANGEVHLYAVWIPITYEIRYENLNGAENASDNPASFTEQNNVIALHEPQGRAGYTFEGWYTDAALTNRVSDTITLNAYHTWTFYAKWTPNKYTITFDSCLGDTVSTETMLMTYDEAANLTLLSEIAAFTKPGYTFMGWSTEKDGEVAYTDGQNVRNLATQGNVNLYAVWKLNVFTISYDVGTGTLSHKNPASYSIEDGDVTLSAPVAKDGYQFLGWYEGDTLVSQIVKGTQKDYNLTAKWAHGGIFSIKLGESYEDGSVQNCGQEYIVTRELPEGTVATANPQYVYYRTVNGTAYGSTVDYSAEQDKYHFKHVGGEDVYLTFGENDFEKRFIVQEWYRMRVTEADAAASFTVSGTDRSYQAELYKIVDTVGTCQGKLGDETSCTKDVLARLTVTTDLYNWHSYLVNAGTVKVTDAGYSSNRRWTVKGTEYLNQSMSSELAKYRDRTATGLGFYINYELREVDDGYQYAQFNYGESYNAGTWLAEYIFATKDDKVAGDWGRKMTLPSNGAKQDADIVFNVGRCKVENYWKWINTTTLYAVVDLDKPINFGFDAGGKNDDDWEYRNLYANFKVYDDRAPQQVGLAPMAFGQYKAGDTISLTVIYDEVIVTAADISLGEIEGLPIADAAYVVGEGTNALTFTATLTEDFEVTPDFNYSIIELKPVTGTVTDILGNK